MTDEQKLETVCLWLVDQANKKDTKEMRVFQDQVKNNAGDELGDWEIIVKRNDKSKIFIP